MSEPFMAPLWRIPVYAKLTGQVDPERNLDQFRGRNVGYCGNLDFWKTPSPEPILPASLVKRLCCPLQSGSPLITAAMNLASQLGKQYTPDELLFVAILRAGVPVADWLTRLIPGSVAVATSLFVGLGIDAIALQAIRSDYPNRKMVFVDGWTGKGGVAGELRRLAAGPLAVLCDPWQMADFRGTIDDVLSPSACFTGPTTLGFSRTFTREDNGIFAAFEFPPELQVAEIVEVWQRSCPPRLSYESEPLTRDGEADAAKPIPNASTPLRLHSNEVCRALINSQPERLMFACFKSEAISRYDLLIELADSLNIPQVFEQSNLSQWNAQVACSLSLQS